MSRNVCSVGSQPTVDPSDWSLVHVGSVVVIILLGEQSLTSKTKGTPLNEVGMIERLSSYACTQSKGICGEGTDCS